MPANAPSAPSVTLRKSSSLPTQANTMSAPCAASRGVAAARVRSGVATSLSQACALALERLYTVTAVSYTHLDVYKRQELAWLAEAVYGGRSTRVRVESLDARQRYANRPGTPEMRLVEGGLLAG